MSFRPLTSLQGGDANVLSSDLPMQVQIYRQLKVEIEDGLWIDREFPGEKELAERFGVSVITSRSALERLGREGLVHRGRGRRGKAIFVPRVNDPSPLTLVTDKKSPYRYSLIGTGVDVAPAAACAAFGLPAGSELWQAVRVLSLRGDARAVTHNAQLPEVGQRHRRRDLNARSMGAILHAEGVELTAIRRQIHATTPPPVVAHHLGLSLDSPVLMVILQVEDDQHRTVEWMRAFGPPDRSFSEDIYNFDAGSWHPSP